MNLNKGALDNIHFQRTMNYTRIWIFATGNEMESLLSAKPNLLWVENNAWQQRETSSLCIII